MYQAIILLWIANTLVNKYLPLLGGRGVVCDRVVNSEAHVLDTHKGVNTIIKEEIGIRKEAGGMRLPTKQTL